MGVKTRSMTHQEAIRQEYLMAPYKKQLLTTPGIITQIANKLPVDDIGFKGLFLLFNDSHYRYELKPFTDIFKQKELNEKHKNIIIHDLQSLFANYEQVNIENSMAKANIVIEIYQYVCDNTKFFELLDKFFVNTVINKLDDLINELNESSRHDFDLHFKIYALSKLNQFRFELKQWFKSF